MKDKVLIVDDSPQNLDILESHLLPLGYDVITASNGKGALSQLAANSNVSLIILDIIMPVLDGYETAKLIRLNPITANIPIIFVTAVVGIDAKLRGIESGGDDFLEKPFNKMELLARTKSLIKKKKLQDELETSYKNLTNIINITEKKLTNFNPLTFDDDIFNESLLKNILKNKNDSTEEEKKPQYVLFIPKMKVNFIGNIFFKKDNALIKIPEDIDIQKSSDKCVYSIIKECKNVAYNEFIYSNWYDSAKNIQEYQTLFDPKVKKHIGLIRNFVAYYTNELAIITFNYGGIVNRFDAQVLKGLLIHANFFKTISEQAKITEDAFLYTIEALARASEANDEDTFSHIKRVNEYAKMIVVAMKMPDKFIEEIFNYAQTHDVGKIHIDRNILRKPGDLTPEEFEEMKKHTTYGATILGNSPRLEIAREIALSHHEKYSGKGYPYNKKGEEIPLSGRIVALADVYDALRNKRYYKPSFSHDESYKLITVGDGRISPQDFDPKVLDIFKQIHKQFEEIYLTIQDDTIKQKPILQ